MNKILFCGIDGFTPSYAEKLLDNSFWHKIKDSCSIAKIPKPEKIKKGDIGTASSPRMWLRYYAGVPPEKGGPCGFWEKYDENGDVHRANVSMDWIRKNRVEKLVDYDDLLVDPLWEVVLKNDLSVGGTSPWFSFPLSDEIKELIDENGEWFLTDWKYPRDHEKNEAKPI